MPEIKLDIEGVFRQIVRENIYKYYLPELVASLEKQALLEALRQCRGNVVQASELIGIHRNSMNRKIKQYGIQNERKIFKLEKIRGR